MEKPIKWNLTRKQNLEINKKNLNHGQMLVIALVVSSVFLILSGAFITFTSREYLNSSLSSRRSQALNIAEAGVEKAIKELNNNPNYTGTNGSTIALFGGEFEVAVSGTGQTRTITATGYVPAKSNYKAKKTVKTNIYVDTQLLSFRYAIQSDTGGVEMKSNSTINGNVYSNGNISGTSNSRIIGDAYATGTISSPNPSVSGTKVAGAPVIPLPVIDLDYWKSEAVKGGTYEGNYTVSGTAKLGPIKINGNLTINSNSTLTLEGPIYVTGNFTMNSNTNLYLNESFGSNGTILVLDGKFNIASNAAMHTTSATPKGYIMIASTNTADDAIAISSNSSNGICYAPNGGVSLESNAKVTSIAAKKIILDSNATINYDLGLANASFSSGPGGGWVIQKGTWIEK